MFRLFEKNLASGLNKSISAFIRAQSTHTPSEIVMLKNGAEMHRNVIEMTMFCIKSLMHDSEGGRRAVQDLITICAHPSDKMAFDIGEITNVSKDSYKYLLDYNFITQAGSKIEPQSTIKEIILSGLKNHNGCFELTVDSVSLPVNPVSLRK